MIGPLQNAMRLQAQRAMAGYVCSRIGIVTSYDPNTFSARVNLQPEEILTGWLPVASAWIGNGWGMFAPPNIGDMVTVEFIDGRIDAGTVTSRFYNDVDRPIAVPAGEFLLQHQTGSLLHFKNDGSVELTSRTDLVVTVGGNLLANVTGNLDATVSGSTSVHSTGNIALHAPTVAVTGNLTVSGSAVVTGEVTGNGIHLSTHVNSGVQSGGSNSGPPV